MYVSHPAMTCSTHLPLPIVGIVHLFPLPSSLLSFSPPLLSFLLPPSLFFLLPSFFLLFPRLLSPHLFQFPSPRLFPPPLVSFPLRAVVRETGVGGKQRMNRELRSTEKQHAATFDFPRIGGNFLGGLSCCCPPVLELQINVNDKNRAENLSWMHYLS